MASDLRDVLLAAEGLSRAEPVQLQLKDVSCEVLDDKRRTRTILAGVSCEFPKGELTAVMGASGSGKTSLLTIMRGLQATGSCLSGEVLCDGRPVSVGMMRGLCNFVPQEDVFLSALTPRETLSYLAELRLPEKWTPAQREARVNDVLELMRLGKAADTKIGDAKVGASGLSGGEKKRLSIGAAIIGGLPSALLCDEPTTGLDAFHAEDVVSLLRSLADRGVTVVCSIHQPAWIVFKQFKRLLLLEDGKVAYWGAVEGVEKHFADKGSPTPEHVNPADHYVKTVQTEEWRRTLGETAGGADAKRRPKPFAVAKGRSSACAHVSLGRQISVLTRRTMHENFKNKAVFFRGIMMRLPASVMTGCFFWQVAAHTTQPYIFPTGGALFCAMQNPVMDSFWGGALTFQNRKGLLAREYYDGLYTIGPYFLSTYIAYVAMQIPWAVFWTVPIYFLCGFAAELSRFLIFFCTVLSLIFMGTAWGSAIGASSPTYDSCRAKLIPIIIPMILFSGYVIPYPQIPWAFTPLYYLSPMQWGITLVSMSHYRGYVFSDCDGDMPRSERTCFATGEEYLREMNNNPESRGVGGIFALVFCYCGFFILLNVKLVKKYVLNGRV